MKPAQAHPSDAELQEFMAGTLADVSDGIVEAHLESCPICQERAAQAPPDRLVSLLRDANNRADATFDTPAAMTSSDTAAWQPSAALDANAPAELANHPRYHLLHLLGSGGMGTVWLAEHKVMGRKVALKLIRPEHLSKPGATERFRREVHAAALLQHPNIVAAHDAEQAGAIHFLAMEYVDGFSLAEHITRTGPLPVAEACRLARDVALGLQHAHEHGLVHRDVKPHNMMLTRAGESHPGPVIKILDFGLAALASGPDGATDLTGTNMVMGTPDYIAPEQAEDPRAADVRSDVYALGCTLYQMLSGRVPFPGGSALRKLDAHRGREPEPIRSLRPEVPTGLAAVLAKMMAKAPAARYQTPAEVATALEPYTRPAPVTSSRKPRRLLVTAVAVALLVGLVLAAAVVYRIQTDGGEVVIRTDDPEIEVILRKGGEIARLRDPRSGKTWELNTKNYQIGMADEPDGLTLQIDEGQTITLRRKDKTVVTVTRGKAVLASTQETVSRIKVLQRVHFPGKPGIYRTAVSPDGRLFAADVDYGRGTSTLVWDAETGKERQRFDPAWQPGFTPDGKRFFYDHAGLHVYDTTTWKKVLSSPPGPGFRGFWVLPDNRHLLAWNALHQMQLISIEDGKVLKSWAYADGVKAWGAATDDARVMFVRPAGATKYQAWDVQKNKPSDEFEQIVNYQEIVMLLPGNKQALVEPGNNLVDVGDGKRVALLKGSWGRYQTLGTALLQPRVHLLGYNDGKLLLVDRLTASERASFQLPAEDTLGWASITLSPDGRHACVATSQSVYLLRLPDPPAGAPELPKATADEPGKIELVRRIPVSAAGDFLYHTAISKGGKYALVTRDTGNGVRLDAFNTKTGEKLFECGGYKADFLGDGEEMVVSSDRFEVYETATGKAVREGQDKNRSLWTLQAAPGGKHLVYFGNSGVALFDLAHMKELHHWPGQFAAGSGVQFLPDGKRLILRLGKDEPWQVWNVEKNCPCTPADIGRLSPETGWFTFLPYGMAAAAARHEEVVRLTFAKDKVVETLGPGIRGGLDFTWSANGRIALGRYDDGSVRLIQVGPRRELGRYDLPREDCAVPNRSVEDAHASMALSSDDGYATVVTQQSMWIFRLPRVPPDKKTP